MILCPTNRPGRPTERLPVNDKLVQHREAMTDLSK